MQILLILYPTGAEAGLDHIVPEGAGKRGIHFRGCDMTIRPRVRIRLEKAKVSKAEADLGGR